MSEVLELKEKVDKALGAFEEFKKANDERIDELKEDKGVGELEQKLDRIGDEITNTMELKQRVDAT